MTSPARPPRDADQVVTARIAEAVLAIASAAASRHHNSNRDLHHVLLVVRHQRLRLVEALGLTWDRVLAEGRARLHIDRELHEDAMTLRAVASGPFESPLAPQVDDMLTQRRIATSWRGGSDPVFAAREVVPGRGRTGRPTWLRPSEVRGRLRRELRASGLEWVTFAGLAAAPVHEGETTAAAESDSRRQPR